MISVGFYALRLGAGVYTDGMDACLHKLDDGVHYVSIKQLDIPTNQAPYHAKYIIYSQIDVYVLFARNTQHLYEQREWFRGPPAGDMEPIKGLGIF